MAGNIVSTESESHSVVSDCVRSHGHGILQARILEWEPFPSPGDLPNPGIEPRSPALWVDSLPGEPQGNPKNIGVSSLSLLQQIFPTQKLNWSLLYCRQIPYQLSYQGSINLIPLYYSKNTLYPTEQTKHLHACSVTQSCLTLCNPMDCRPPGPSDHGTFQARILEWVAISFSRGYSRSRDQTRISCVS